MYLYILYVTSSRLHRIKNLKGDNSTWQHRKHLNFSKAILKNKDSFFSFYEVLQHLLLTFWEWEKQGVILLSRSFESMEKGTKSYEGMSRICRQRRRLTEAMVLIHCSLLRFLYEQRHTKNIALNNILQLKTANVIQRYPRVQFVVF